LSSSSTRATLPPTVLYDAIGRTYTATRREDPRLAAAIHAALGDARTVLNVGAGAGAYEPRDRDVLAVEPSAVMRAQRPPGAAPAIAARAEALPLPDRACDAAMAVLSDHHWTDRLGGLRELRRVATRAVVFTYDEERLDDSWIVREYFPHLALADPLPLAALTEALGGAEARAVPIPHDCRDGFLHAWWRRPEAYLDPAVRAGISLFARSTPEQLAPGLAALEADLRSGAWHERHADLLAREACDLGYVLLVA
jgi:SAM-dependent methyltransferase